MIITTLHGDCREMLQTLPAGSVQTVVTSPPYYGLRRYTDDPREIGQEATPSLYVAALVEVFRQVRRVMRDDGVVWLNLGDSYAQDSKWGGASGGKNYTSAAGDLPRDRKHSGMKDKDLLGIPWRVAFALQDDGWYLRSDIIWAKPNCMPESVTDRPTRAHEYVFLLTKQARYFYDAAAIAEPIQQSSIDRINQPTFNEQTGGPKDYGTTGVNTNRSMRKTLENFKQNGSGTRNRRTVWTIATQPYSGAHYATMPEALIAPCILAGSSATACETCGAAWGRVVERGMPSADSDRPQQRRAAELWIEKGLTDEHLIALRAVGMADAGKAKVTMTGYGKNTPEAQRLADEAKIALGGYIREFMGMNNSTTGFAPRCACPDNTGSAQSVVLDPFAGSGTVQRVAARYQRDAIGIELNQTYIEEHVEKRTNGVQVELFV